MGRTVPTLRNVVEVEIKKWREFRRALREREKQAFDRLMDKIRSHASAAGYMVNSNPFESMIFSILLEQEIEIQELRREIEELRARLKKLKLEEHA
jgi:hypothetical protein